MRSDSRSISLQMLLSYLAGVVWTTANVDDFNVAASLALGLSVV